jgi:uridine kinase
VQQVASEPGAVVRAVRELSLGGSRPPVIGISGFGGSGKSTLAGLVRAGLPGSAVVPADEFLRTRPPADRSPDWAAVDRDRLRRQVLAPVHAGEPAAYQVWDPAVGAPGPWVSLAGAAAVVVEGLGLFVPDLLELFDVRVWLDVDLDTATARGRWRDEHVYGNPQTELWLDVWKPNDADFHRRFRPDETATIRYLPVRL